MLVDALLAPTHRSYPANVLTGLLQSALALAVLTALLLWVVHSSGTLFSRLDTLSVLGYQCALAGGALALCALVPIPHFRAAGVSGVFALGVWTVFVLPATTQASVAPPLAWATLGLSTFAVHTACLAIERSPRRFSLLPALALAPVLVLAVLVLRAHPPSSSQDPDVPYDPYSPDLRPLVFQRTPNLYFLSFESLAPGELIRRRTGFPLPALPLESVISRRMRPVGALYANGAATLGSFNLIAALSPRALARITDPAVDTHLPLFSGARPAALFEILRANGYRVETVYDTGYFSALPGPGVDAHYIVSGRTACFLDPPDPQAYWGWCTFSSPWHHLVEALGPDGAFLSYLEAGPSSRPRFVWIHLWLPGHVPGDYRSPSSASRRAFAAGYHAASRHAGGWLDLALDRIASSDPGAIVLAFGDHGPFLDDGGVPFLTGSPDSTSELRGLFSVLGGIHPPGACRAEIDAATAPGWLTHLDLVHALLRCLSGGVDARLEPTEYRPLYLNSGPAYPGPAPFGDVRYSDFVVPWAPDLEANSP